jgi:ribosome-associated translation inhibitor RaiA
MCIGCIARRSGFSDAQVHQKLLFQNLHATDIAASFNRWRSVMQVLFKSRHPDADPLRELAERRVRFVLRRLAWLVPRAEVQMSDVNGPRGGIDKRCQVELKTDGAGSVIVAAVANDWRSALDNALSRAARFLMRHWQRGSDSRRMRQRLGGPVALMLHEQAPVLATPRSRP